MDQEFQKTKDILERSQRILLTTHERTDGDDLGSVLALAHHLQSVGKDITIAIKGGVPKNLHFLPGKDLVAEDIAPEATFDLVVFSGCSQKERCNNPHILALAAPILNIDHHPDNKRFGDVNLVEPTKSAVAELVFDFFLAAQWNITSSIATCLLTGIFTDTGSFMHSNTKDTTLKAAAELMRRGALTSTIARHTYRGKDPDTLKAWGKALENSYYDEERHIIYSVITRDDIGELGQLPVGTFEGLVETLNKVPEAKFALFLKQEGDTIKGSLRSDVHKGVNVGGIARLFGGGGHQWASGFSVIGKLTKTPQGSWQVES